MSEPRAPLGEPVVTSAFPPRDTAPGGYLEPIRAAGAVLWRPRQGGPAGDGDTAASDREVLLVHRPDRGDWTLPKGKLKNGEHTLTAAVREVTEETGCVPVMGRRLPPQRYLKNGWPKQVEWWAATPAGAGMSAFAPNDEIDAAEWVGLGAARDRLTYGHDVQVLDNFALGPARTVPVVVLRHATAGEKGGAGDDLLRPLDTAGRADAVELADVLGAFGAMAVVSSAAARCTETVLPYAMAHSAAVATGYPYTVGAGADGGFDVEGAREAFAGLLDRRRPTLLCTHGELVGGLLRDALGRLGAAIPQQPGLRKGSFWVIHLDAADGGLAGAERHSARG
ncbi:NUDIX domain-containing protein [Nocardiopsis sediminis]|uniref:NUDIX domain-containing protein n=1 Tax=Nocardiopsis sediminis TaxID=1778267 RepID=A0ABV8FZA0_9ACTN